MINKNIYTLNQINIFYLSLLYYLETTRTNSIRDCPQIKVLPKANGSLIYGSHLYFTSLIEYTSINSIYCFIKSS